MLKREQKMAVSYILEGFGKKLNISKFRLGEGNG